MADHDKGATVRLAATIARSRYESDGGTLLDGIHPDTIVEMALAAKREVDSLRADLARVTAERDVASSSLRSIVSELRNALGDFRIFGENYIDEVKRLRARYDVVRDENAELRETLCLAVTRGTDALDQLGREQLRRRELIDALPSDRALLMFAEAVPHHPLFSQAMRDECTDAIMRLSQAIKENVGDR